MAVVRVTITYTDSFGNARLLYNRNDAEVTVGYGDTDMLISEMSL